MSGKEGRRVSLPYEGFTVGEDIAEGSGSRWEESCVIETGVGSKLVWSCRRL